MFKSNSQISEFMYLVTLLLRRNLKPQYSEKIYSQIYNNSHRRQLDELSLKKKITKTSKSDTMCAITRHIASTPALVKIHY